MDYDRDYTHQCRTQSEPLERKEIYKGLGQVNSDRVESSGVQLLNRLESLANRTHELADRLEGQLSPAMWPSSPQASTTKLASDKPIFFSRADNSMNGLEAALDNLQSISERLDF